MRDEEFAIHSLRETLKLLALSPGEQVAALPPYVVVPDELALTFDDAYLHVPLLHERGHVSATTKESLDAINGLLTRMTKDGEDAYNAYNLYALSHDPRWDEVRMLAATALRHQEWPEGWPVLDWIFVRARGRPGLDTAPGRTVLDALYLPVPLRWREPADIDRTTLGRFGLPFRR